MQLSRRTVFPTLMAAFARVKIPPPQPTSFEGVINAANYPNLQTAANAAFGTLADPNGTARVTYNKVLFIPPGIYGPPFSGAPVLDLRYLHGGRIIGSGRFVTKLRQNVADVPVIRTNGCGYSHFEGMFLEHQVGVPGTCFDLNWDGTVGGAALQSNTFADLEFYGGSLGINIGAGGFMGSENLFQNCFWLLNSNAGVATSNFNALQQTIIGGNFQTCGKAIWIGVGSVNVIHGVGFQQSVECDILTSGSANNGMHVAGCRTESKNFILNDASHALTVESCTQNSVADGIFVRSIGGLVKVGQCVSTKGQVVGRGWSQTTIENSYFQRQSAFDASGLGLYATYQGAMEFRNVYDLDDNGVDRLTRNAHWAMTANGLLKLSGAYV